MNKAFDGIENISEENSVTEDTVKHKALYAGFVLTTLIAPYVSGAIILSCKDKLESWNWL